MPKIFFGWLVQTCSVQTFNKFNLQKGYIIQFIIVKGVHKFIVSCPIPKDP